MPLAPLQSEITQRFHEVDLSLVEIAAAESSDPTIPGSAELRGRRGLFFVHLYGAFEYALEQSFSRLARAISVGSVPYVHLHKPIYAVAMESDFTALQQLRNWPKRVQKRIDLVKQMKSADAVVIPDSVLSSGMQSVSVEVISLAFELYGIPSPPFADVTVAGYIREVVEKRHAVAHGRESPVQVGGMRVEELRRRYAALYLQANYVVDTVSGFIAAKKYVSGRYRARY